MRLPIFFLAFCAFIGSVAASERSPQYPYRAPIVSEVAPVLSGPGAEYYTTSTLRRGENVEVYYETEDWCAVRPPIGSFSWISARYVDLDPNGIGTVLADGLASRIGSEETELCDTVLVKLRKGEKVLVTGRRETPDNPASPLWYKIAPPSGEFRWIPRAALFGELRTPTPGHITQVAYESEAPAPSGLRLPAPPSSLQAPRRTPPVETVAPEKTTSKMLDLLNRKEAVTVELPKETVEKEVPSNPAAASASSDVLKIPPLSDKLASSRPDSVRIEIPVKEVDPIRAAFDQAFEELQQETRNVLTRPTEDWVFQTLIDRGDELYKVAPTDADLEKVYHLVETLQRTWAVRKEIAYRRQFRTGGLLTPPPSATPSPATYSASTVSAGTVSAGYTRNNGAPAPQTAQQPLPASAPAAVPASYASTVANSAAGAAGPGTKSLESVPGIPADKSKQHGFKLHGFDVVGKLGEFETPPKDYPPYAVVDENERILCLITPAVGIEMREHVGKLVGINGILGFYEKGNQPKRRHITVQEIDILR